MQVQVYKIHSDFYYVKNYKGEEFSSKLRDVLKKQKIAIKVGDFVELSEDFNFIVSLAERKNSLERPKVSNIDCALIVASLVQPELDLIQLNRYLIYMKYNKIPAAICFNKLDLLENSGEKINEINSIYKNLGYETFFVSAKNNKNLSEISDFIKNKTIVLCGMSGVGKSTLLNGLNFDFKARTGEVSNKTQRGCHTTRHCEIIDCKDFKLIDTPGFSCLKFDFLLPDEIINLFDDIKIYAFECKYSDCLHNINNNDCNIFKNLDKISKSRYESYLCFLNEALEYKKIISKRSIKKESLNKNTGNKISVKISKRKRNVSRNTDKQRIKGIE